MRWKSCAPCCVSVYNVDGITALPGMAGVKKSTKAK